MNDFFELAESEKENKASEMALVFVDNIGMNSNGEYEYEFYFSKDPDNVWGEDWNEMCPSACGNLRPDLSDITFIKRLVTDMKIKMAQDNNCFSMQDMIDHIIACCWFEDEKVSITRVMPFGMAYDEVKNLLLKSGMKFNIEFIEREETEEETDGD